MEEPSSPRHVVMEDTQTVSATVSESERSKRPVALSLSESSKELPTRSNPSPNSDASDAVMVSLSKDVSEEQPEVKEEPVLSREEAETVARDLSAKINQTQVKFEVSIQGEDRNSMRFVIIEKETGEVVRKFPPEAARALSVSQAFTKQGTTLLEESA